MLFKDLANDLKKVKTPDDVSVELAQEMIMAGISVHMGALMREGMTHEEAFDTSRMMVLKIYDLMFVEVVAAAEEDED